jgi:phosphoribosylformylglycinamidine synthase
VLLGENSGELGGSEYLALMHDTVAGPPPQLDLAREQRLQQLLVQAIREGLIESAHDCAEGGLAIALAECCFETPFGVTANVPEVGSVQAAFGAHATLFGESASRVIVSVRRNTLDALRAIATRLHVPIAVIGETGGDHITLKVDGQVMVDVAAKEAEAAWSTAIEKKMAR